MKEVVPFGKIDMLKAVKFHKVKNQFSTKLKDDIEAVKQSKKKETNIFRQNIEHASISQKTT